MELLSETMWQARPQPQAVAASRSIKSAGSCAYAQVDPPAENHLRRDALVGRSRPPDLLLFGLSMGSGHQACDQPLLASSSQRRVAPSVQPGTAKRAPGAVKPWLGRTMTGRGLE